MQKRLDNGFTLVEMMISVLLLGLVLAAFMGVFSVYQKSALQNSHYAETQQNTRIALDYVTEFLRQAGAGTDYVRGQRFIVHAAPYQIVFNGDIDNSQTVGNQAPLEAINLAFSPNSVPPSGTVLYAPTRNYTSTAETIALTIDSNDDGVVDAGDRGDDVDEDGHNKNLFLLKKVTYGFNGTNNEVRDSDLALVRGATAYPNGDRPQPLFKYKYDHDDDVSTPERLWGDASGDGKLDNSEIVALTPVPNNLLPRIRKVQVTVISESDKYNKRYKDNNGFLAVEMRSEVYVRNATRTGSVIYGQVYHDANGDGDIDDGETGIPNVEVRLMGINRTVITNSTGNYYLPVAGGDYSVQEFDPPGFTSTTPNLVSVTVASGEVVQVNFGDEAGGAIGFIKGKVFDDIDEDGLPGSNEPGIEDVLISLDTGEQVKTDSGGSYAFLVPLGNYNVVETDPEGYGSTTPNDAEAVLVADGDSVVIDFGDTSNPTYGRIEGYVWEDEDQNGAWDSGEWGIPNVTLKLSTGDSTLTNSMGFYQFTIPPAVYDITERDIAGYTSSTVNR